MDLALRPCTSFAEYASATKPGSGMEVVRQHCGAGATDQGLDLHDFATFLNAIRTGDTYANLHTTRFPAGEIRGQLTVRRANWDDADN